MTESGRQKKKTEERNLEYDLSKEKKVSWGSPLFTFTLSLCAGYSQKKNNFDRESKRQGEKAARKKRTTKKGKSNYRSVRYGSNVS